MINSYILILSYQGTDFFGWQIQNQRNQPTIQGEIEKALKLNNADGFIGCIGASRTDRGVHALGQVCRVQLNYKISENGLRKVLNDRLPPSIRVKTVRVCEESFHPIRDTKLKTYKYYFSNHKNLAPDLSPFVYQQNRTLDLKLMKEAAIKFLGTHDFQNFFCTGSANHGTVREIFKSEVYIESLQSVYSKEDVFCFEVCGSGFLKQMVRLMVGAIISCGEGRVQCSELVRTLNESSDKKLSPVAPALGLCLIGMQLELNWD